MQLQRQRNFDPTFRWLATGCGALIILLVAGIFWELYQGSQLSLEKFGFGFLFSQAWNPVKEDFGAASSIYGTLVSTAIAMFIAVPLSLVIALFLVELAPPRVSRVVGGCDRAAGRHPQHHLRHVGAVRLCPLHGRPRPAGSGQNRRAAFFKGPPMGIGMLTAGIILALMILPFITSVTRDIFLMVPAVVKESAYGMGSTTWEVSRKVTVPYGIQGIVGACFLGLGRAIGETMAVTFVIGNRHEISASLFSAANSIASTLANEFTEASEDIYLSSLVELGLVLFAVTFLLQLAAQIWLKRTKRKMGVA